MGITPNAFGMGCLGGRMNHCFFFFFLQWHLQWCGCAQELLSFMWKRQGEREIASLEMEVWGSALIFHDQHYYLVNTSLSWAGRACEESLNRLAGEKVHCCTCTLSSCFITYQNNYFLLLEFSHGTMSQDLCQTNPGKVLDGAWLCGGWPVLYRLYERILNCPLK